MLSANDAGPASLIRSLVKRADVYLKQGNSNAAAHRRAARLGALSQDTTRTPYSSLTDSRLRRRHVLKTAAVNVTSTRDSDRGRASIFPQRSARRIRKRWRRHSGKLTDAVGAAQGSSASTIRVLGHRHGAPGRYQHLLFELDAPLASTSR